MRTLIASDDLRLARPSRHVTQEEILNGAFEDLVTDMRFYLAPDKGIGIAAPQLGEMVRIVAFEDTSEHMAHVSEERRRLIGRHPIPYVVLYNPSIQFLDPDEEDDYPETCLSHPGMIGIVPRSKRVQVYALNARAESIKFIATNWFARCIQHEVDHLNGISFLDCALPKSIMRIETFIEQWAGKTSEEYRSAFSE